MTATASATLQTDAARSAGDFESAFAELSRRQSGYPAWAREYRAAAWEAFKDAPMPTLKDEDWRRTDIRALKLERFNPLPGPAESYDPAKIPQVYPWAAGSLVRVDGALVAAQGSTSLAEAKIVFGDLASLIAQDHPLVRKHVAGPSDESPVRKFTTLASAFLDGGSFVYVPTGVRLAEPLVLHNYLKRPGQADFDRTIVVAEEGAEVVVIQELASLDAGADGLHCGWVEIVAGPGSNVTFLQVQRFNHRVWSFSRRVMTTHSQARAQIITGEFGGRLSKSNQDLVMAGPGGEADMLGILIAAESQLLSPSTLQDHRVHDNKSDLLYKSVLLDSSRTVWRGNIHVHGGAQKTNAYQAEHNLVLSPDARADSIPGLEIEADDVRCTHGATVGRVDDEQMFYLRSRGISKSQATWMIVNGFVDPVLARVSSPQAREVLAGAVQGKLGELTAIAP